MSVTKTRNGKAAILGDRFTKPPAPVVDPDAIPDGLRLFDRWLGWRWRWNDRAKKWDKPPVNARTGGPGSSTDPATWCSFAEAIAAQRAGRVDGIGFALGEADGNVQFAGIDLDDCRDRETGELTDLARDILGTMNTYSEVSPSGSGIKLLCIGALPAGSRCKSAAGNVEIYGRGRYFTITGQRVEGTPKRVEARQEQLMAVWAKYIGDRSAPTATTNGHASPAADRCLAAMFRVPMPATENDSSGRLLAVARQAKRYGFTGGDGVALVRRYATQYPFAREFTDDEILRRIDDANVLAGEALAAAPKKCTDLGNAERFAAQHGADVRYCHPWKKWFVWDGRRWCEDTTGEVMRRAKQTARSIYREALEAADEEQRKPLARWAVASEKRDKLTAMLALAQSEQPIPIAPENLDAAPWLLNCQNGTIDLRTGQLREHRREDYVTKICPIEYASEAGDDPVLWLEFLGEIFDGNAEIIGFLRRLIGMALVGEVVEHVLPIFHGVGANGKTVLIETVCGMLGSDYAMSAPAGLLMVTKSERHPTELADLHGKRLVAAVETADYGRLSESLVKQLTGGDSIRARRMREDFWQFRPSHTVILATNHRPTIRGTDHGIWRRICLVPFNVVIPEARQDKRLAAKLRAEWPAILRWAVAGCLEWQRTGLGAPPTVRAATDEYRASEDLLGQYVDERCVVEKHCEVRAGDLYADYRRWCEARGEIVETQTRFGRRMTERGFRRERGVDGRKRYVGLGLLPEGENSLNG